MDGNKKQKLKDPLQQVDVVHLPPINRDRCFTPPNQGVTPLTKPFVIRKGLVLNSLQNNDNSKLEFP